MPVILVTWETEIRRMKCKDSPGKKLERPHLNRKKAGCGGTYLAFQQQQEAKMGGLWFRPAWAKSETLL
jgi:hypothetical protein